MAPESNALASHNGIEMENIIKALYPGAEFHYKGLIDFTIDGVLVEIKSCQETITDDSHSTRSRSGRFVFNSLQHQSLIENAGHYIFLVHQGSSLIFFARVPAIELNLGKFSGEKSVCWKTLIKGAV